MGAAPWWVLRCAVGGCWVLHPRLCTKPCSCVPRHHNPPNSPYLTPHITHHPTPPHPPTPPPTFNPHTHTPPHPSTPTTNPPLPHTHKPTTNPPHPCLQVRVLRDYSDVVFSSGKVSLRRGKSHWLPSDEVHPLVMDGVLELVGGAGGS